MDLNRHLPVGAGAAADGQDTVEPGRGRIRGLEPHHCAEIVQRRIDGLVAGEPLHHLGRAVAVAVGVDQDLAARMGLDGVARMQVHDAVGAHDLPVGAARQHLAVEPRPFDRAAEDVDDATLAIGRVAEHLDAAERRRQRENRRLGNERHGCLTPAPATPKFRHETGAQAMRTAAISGLSMKRRDAIKLLGAAAASQLWPVSGHGQARKKIGFLYPGLSGPGKIRLQAFREGLREAGWGDAQVEIEARYAEGVVARNHTLAAELVAAKVDVLVPISFISVEAARAVTKTIPIVVGDLETDPIANGIAATLARPGGNITGVYFDFPDFSTKWIELLKEAMTRLSKVIVVRDPASPSPQLKGVQAAAGWMSVKLDLIDVGSFEEFDAAFQSVGGQRPDAVLILSSPLFGTNPGRVAELTTKYRLPTIMLFPEFARAGGLMAYGVNLLGMFHQVD